MRKRIVLLNKLCIIIFFLIFYGCKENIPDELPNILWLTSEDNSPFLGCYGDSFATTPNLDKFASEGFLYTHAYANAPVCAPARNTIISGVYANSSGNQHMRSKNAKSDNVKLYPQLLKELGYYCTNNYKTDYNLSSKELVTLWNESSKQAHYKNRPEGKPFFAIFNTTVTHESSIFKLTPNEKLKHNPQKVTIAPYHPQTPEMKHDWAQYYDRIQKMDEWVGKKLKELEEAGLAENTIVFYYADHGGILGRSKRYIYETGTHVPFIVRIPEKYKHLYPKKSIGSKVNRLISFVDLVPTLLSIADANIPNYLQGNAFLGKKKTEDPEYVFMFRGRMDERYDMSRAVRDNQFRYIRNYMPHRPYGQYLEYLWKAPSMQSWERAYKNGECNNIQSIFWNPKPVEELYDTENDPWETNNLTENEDYADVLLRMRKASIDWSIKIKDTGFLPEHEMLQRINSKAPYDFFHSGNFDIEPLIHAANLALEKNPQNIDKLCENLKGSESGIRYWGATGLLLLNNATNKCLVNLINASADSSFIVRAVSAEALYNFGEIKTAEKMLLKCLDKTTGYSLCFVLNIIDCLNIEGIEFKEKISKLSSKRTNKKGDNYAQRMAAGLLKKWDII